MRNLLSAAKKLIAILLVAVLLLDDHVIVLADSIAEAVETAASESEKKEEYEQLVSETESQVVPEELSEASNAAEDVSESDTDAAETVEDIIPEVSLRLPEASLVGASNSGSLSGIYGEPVAADDYTTTYQVDETHFITVINSTKKTFTDENGEEREYDLSLVPTDPISGIEVTAPTDAEIRDENLAVNYSPRETAVDVILPANVTEEQGIIVTNGEDSLEIFPLEGKYGNATIKDNALLYNSVQADTDVQYEINENGLKEGIILQSWTGKNEYNYSFKKNGYAARLEANNIYVTRSDDTEVLFIISAPIMFDNAGNESSDVEVLLSETETEYIVTLSANRDWLAAPERSYPVTIDPTIEVPTENLIEVTTSTIHGTYHGEGYGYAGYITARMTGVAGAKDIGRSRMYFKINYDFRGNIPEEARIDSATLNVYQYGNYASTTATFACYRIRDSWDPGSLTWDNSVGLNLEPSGENSVFPASKGMYYFDIRESVNNWVQGLQDNNGLVIMATDESAIGSCFYTPNSTGTGGQTDFTWDKRPSITINWSVPDPVDANYSIDDTSITLRTMILTDKNGKLQFEGVFADGTATPGSVVSYALNDASKEYNGQNLASFSYKYPDSSAFDSVFPAGTTKYKDKLGNWQTLYPFTEPEFNVLYNIKASASKNGVTGRENTSDDFTVYKVTQYDTLPKIAAYYGIPLAQIMFDNRVQDMLLVANNTLFIRNPQKNATVPYNPPALTDDEKAKIDAQLMGRGLHCEFGFEPVNMNTGNFYLNRTDISIPDYTGNFDIERNYNSKGAGFNSMFGRGWSFEYDEQLTQDENGSLYYKRADGSILVFENTGAGYECPDGYNLTLEKCQIGEKSYDFGAGEENYPVYEYVIKDAENTEKVFNFYGMLTSIKDEKGNTTILSYDENMKLTSVKSPAGTVYGFTVSDDGYITAISLPNGSSLGYSYDANGNLIAYTDANGNVTRYEYDVKHLMTAWYDGGNNLIVRNEYDEAGRVVKQTDGNGAVSSIAYEEGRTTATDANGNATTYVLDDQLRTVEVINPDGTIRSMGYDAYNNLASETDELGHTTAYTYDEDGNEISRIRFDGASKTFTYDDNNHITRAVGYDGVVTDYTYDTAGNLVSIVVDSVRQVSYSYDNYGRILSMTDTNGNTSYFTYTGANLTQVTDAKGYKTTMSYNAHGLVTTVENAEGGVSSTVYDAEGRTLSETSPEGHTKSYAFDGSGNVIAYTDGNGNSFSFSYDAMGNQLSITAPDGGTSASAYDAVGNKTSETDAEGNTTSYTYDSRGRVVSRKDADGTSLSYTYDALGNTTSVTDKKGHVTSYTYDYAQEEIASITDAMGQTISFELAEGALPVKVTYPDGSIETAEFDVFGRKLTETDAAGRVTNYSYDSNGNMLSEVIANNTTTYQYDSLNKVTAITYNDGATIQFAYDALGHVITKTDAAGEVTEYSYDKDGVLISTKDALGAVTGIGYDGNANQTSVTDAAGNTSTISYNYLDLPTSTVDAMGNVTSFAYDKVGNVTAIINALDGKTFYTYDSLYRQNSVTDPNGNSSTIAYDANGKVTRVDSPDGSFVTYEYDALDRVTKETYSSGLVVEYEYDWRGNIIHNWDNEAFDEYYEYNVYDNQTAVTNSLGETTTIAYDELQRIVSVTEADGSTNTYTYDAAGNIASETDAEGKETVYSYDINGNLLSKTDASGREWTYTYDALGKLQSITDPAGGLTLYRYDLLGNLTKVTDPEENVTSYGYNALSELVIQTDPNGNKTLMSYDPLGRIVSATTAEGGVESYHYDANGNQTGYTDEEGNVTSYAYDAVNRVISTTLPNGGVYTYAYDDNDALLSETDPLGGITSYENNLHGQAVKRTLANGAEYTYAYDALGRVVNVGSPQGLRRAYTYDVSGNLVKETDQSERETNYTYDIMGRLLTVTNALDQTTTYTYDTNGNLASASTPMGNTTSFAYDVLDRLTEMTDPVGITETYSYDKINNLLSLSVNGKHTTTYTYDGNGNVLTVTNPLDEVMTNTYDSMNRLTERKDAAGNATVYAYDKLSRLISVRDAAGKTTDYVYDGNGNLLSMRNGEGRGVSYSYDLLDRVVTAAAGGTSVQSTYAYNDSIFSTDDVQNVGAPEGTGLPESANTGDIPKSTTSGVAYTYQYDAVGNLTSTIDGNGNANTFSYDLLSNLTSKTDGLGNTESYTYDADNNLSAVTRPNGKTISYNYNKLDALLTADYSDENDGTVLLAYDNDGRRITMEDLTGESIYEYDEDNRLTGVQQGDGSVIRYSYDEFGNISELTYPDGKKVAYTYDALDRLTGVIDRDGKETSYTYDTAGNMTEVKRANGTSASISYDPSGLVTEVKNLDASGKAVSEYKYTYDLSGYILSEEVTVDGITEINTYSYDGAGQLSSSFTTNSEGATLAKTTYAYDAAGNRVSAIISRKTVQEAIENKTITFSYNAANQLTKMADSEDGTTEYLYDANGNRIRAAKAGESVLDYTYDTENRLTAITDSEGLLMTALYDGDDNRVFLASRKQGEKEYKVYIEEPERAKSAKTSEQGKLGSLFWYGFAGNMLQSIVTAKDTVGNFWVETWTDLASAYHRKIVKDRADKEGIVANPRGITNTPGDGDVTYKSEYSGAKTLIPYTTKKDKFYYYEMRNFVNDINQTNAQVLTAYDENGKQTEAYSYGNSRLDYNDGLTTYYYAYTGTGTVAQLLDAAGSVASLYKADDYGNMTVSGAAVTGNPYGYNAEYTDPTGYQYLRARYYDSASGTFLTADSYLGSVMEPMTLNLYAYAQNNPVNYADPSGHGFFSAIGEGLQKIGQGIQKVASNVASTVQKAATAVVNGVKAVGNTIVSGVNAAINWVGEKVSSAVKWVKNTFNKAKEATVQVYNEAKEAVKREAIRIYQTTSEALEKTKRFVCTTANRIKEGAVEFVKNVDWKKVAIGVGAAVAIAGVTVLTGGAAAPVLIGAAVGAGSGAVINGAMTAIQGGSIADIAKSASDGFMWGGIGGAAGAGVGQALSKAGPLVNRLVSSGTDTLLDTAQSAIKGEKVSLLSVGASFAMNFALAGGGGKKADDVIDSVTDNVSRQAKDEVTDSASNKASKKILNNSSNNVGGSVLASSTDSASDTITKNLSGNVVDEVGEKSAAVGQKTYQTYAKVNNKTGEIYIGRTSGTGTPLENVANRDARHHMTEKGFGSAILLDSSTNKDAIRGREQILIDIYGRAKSEGGSAGNAIRGISKKNKKLLNYYLEESIKEFGSDIKRIDV